MIEYEMLPYARKTFTKAFSAEDYVILAFHRIAFSSSKIKSLALFLKFETLFIG
jgi:hypothetical protein